MMFRFATYPSLKDRTVIVTGGATGIGAGMVEEFVTQGSQVVFLDSNAEAGRELEQATGARFLACDLRDVAALRAALAGIQTSRFW